MYKQKRKAITNKENRDEENKMSKSNITELIKECSTSQGKKEQLKTPQPKHKGKDHLNWSSIDFIKSIGWMDEDETVNHSKHHSRDYNYGYNGGNYSNNYYQNSNSSWTSHKNYNGNKKNYFYKNDYRR